MKTTFDVKNNSLTFLVNTKIYPKEVLYKACYAFIDKAYLFLEVANQKDFLAVSLKGKTALSKKEVEKLTGEFGNELLNCLVRENVSKRNQKVLEQIVGGAMGAALGIGGVENESEAGCEENCDCETDKNEEREIEAAVEALRKELEAMEVEDDYENDTLGIREIVAVEEVGQKKVSPKPKQTKQNKVKKNAKRK